MRPAQLCVAVYANVAWLILLHMHWVHIETLSWSKKMNRINITQTLLTYAAGLALIGYVAYQGAMNAL